MGRAAKCAIATLLVLVVAVLPLISSAEARGTRDWVRWAGGPWGLNMTVGNEPPQGTPIHGFRAVFAYANASVTSSPEGWYVKSSGAGVLWWTDSNPIHTHRQASGFSVVYYGQYQNVTVTWYTLSGNGRVIDSGRFNVFWP